jgi:hypothetical protein
LGSGACAAQFAPALLTFRSLPSGDSSSHWCERWCSTTLYWLAAMNTGSGLGVST